MRAYTFLPYISRMVRGGLIFVMIFQSFFAYAWADDELTEDEYLKEMFRIMDKAKTPEQHKKHLLWLTNKDLYTDDGDIIDNDGTSLSFDEFRNSMGL